MSKAKNHRKTSTKPQAVCLEFLVEEESAVESLKPILARLFADRQVKISYRKFRGKPDLLKNLPDRLRGYAAARRRGEDIRVIVLVDRDTEDCIKLKGRLDEMTRDAGLISRSTRSPAGDFHVLNRIAVRELESWYFGDWPAVRAAFPKAPPEPPRSYKGNPDLGTGKCSDAFEKMLLASGVRIASKPEWGRRIGPHMSLDNNRSPSFTAFISGVRDIASF